MTLRTTLLTLAIGASLLALSACNRDAPKSDAAAGTAAPAEADKDADALVARVNREYKAGYPEITAAQWVSSTYINDDTQLVSAKANERFLAQLNGWIRAAKPFEGQKMSPESARSILLMKLSTAMPPPNDPKKLAELTRIASKMEGDYGAGKYCTGDGDAKTCRDLGELSDVLAHDRDYQAQLDAWQGWHTISQPMRKDYVRFVELVNEGAKEMGFADAGEMWRSGYDMTPAELAAETDRLWGQVKPLYEQLHCYTRTRLQAKYGADKGAVAGGMIPAHLTGNMWQQDWGNLWDVLEPYQDAGSLDITSVLEKRYKTHYAEELAKTGPDAGTAALADADHQAQVDTAKEMAQRAEDFYVSLGMPKLPETYWSNSQFVKPRDRDVVCHASAWDMNMAGDVRTKMCIKPNEEEFTTIYHELGHVYYSLAYTKQPPLFQAGAHDGFHEAIGDTIVLS
ncbi:MAG: M2 family metallopeptidase, partial [Lysobacteraceae bacterium]